MKNTIWALGFNVKTRMDPDTALADYWRAPSGGPMHAAWDNKPHRLLYDLVGEVQHLRHALELIGDHTKCDHDHVSDKAALQHAHAVVQATLAGAK